MISLILSIGLMAMSVQKIKKAPAFINAKNRFKKSNQSRLDGSISFETPTDLFLAIHKASLHFEITTSYASNSRIEDTYNFESWNYRKLKDISDLPKTISHNFVVVVNNLATYAEDIGALNSYHIKLYFIA